MIITESGYCAYHIKTQISIGVPQGSRKLTDEELVTLVTLVKKWMEEGKKNDSD